MKLTSQPSDNYIILSKYSYDPNGRSYGISYQGGGAGFTCIVNATGESGKNYVLTSNTAIPVGEWYHLACTYAPDGAIRLFVDGENVAIADKGPTSIATNDSDFRIGTADVPSEYDNAFDGLIDEVRVWSVARTGEEIRRDMRRVLTGDEPGLEGYWRFEGDPTDRSPNHNDLTPYNAPTFSDDVPFTESDPLPHATSSVAFLPGIMGSRLYDEVGGSERKRWESVMAGDIAALGMHADGTSESTTLYTKDIVDTMRPVTGLGSFGEAYEGWASFLDDLVAHGGLAEWEAIPYDWRLATDELVRTGLDMGGGRVTYVGAPSDPIPPILARLAALADRSPSGKVTIIAHSNGGLVAKHILRYLEEHDDPLLGKIDTVVLVASPQAGTPKAVRELLHGIDMPAQEVLRETVAHMPGALGLLPSPLLIPLLSEPVVEVDKSVSSLSLMQDLAGTSITTYDGLRSFLTGETGVRAPHQTIGYLHPNMLSPTLLADAAAMHGDIDVWRATSSVRVVEVVGTGLWTPRGVGYRAEDKVSASGLTLPTLRTEWLANARGDGTVLVTSAESGEADETYYFDVARYNADKGVNSAHGTLLSTTPVQTLVEGLLGGSDEVPLYMNTTGADDPMPRFELRAYSPVDLHLTRGAFHTGVVARVPTDLGRYFEERVPNSKYEEWVDVKYLAGDLSGGPLTLSLKGTGSGLFTLTYTRYDSGGGTTTFVFAGVPVSKVSKGSLVLVESGTPLLHYDVNGDGVTDVRLAPNGAGGGVSAQLHLTALKQTLRDTAMPAWLRTWLMTQYTFAEREYKKGTVSGRLAAKGALAQMAAAIAQQTPKAIAPDDAAALQTLVRALMAKL